MKPAVSVVVPCYNKEAYVEGMLRSLLGQAWPSLQLIFVNDGSTDGTRRILGEWMPRWREKGYDALIVDQPNQNLAAAVGAGLRHAVGQYVCTVDCDDELDAQFISYQVQALEENPAYSWTVSAMASRRYADDTTGLVSSIAYADEWLSPKAIQSFLLHRITSSACCHLVKADYLQHCRIQEYMALPSLSSQEPYYVSPLIMGGGRILPVKKAVYIHNSYAVGLSAPDSWEAIDQFYRQVVEAQQRVFEKMQLPQNQQRQYLALAQVGRLYHAAWRVAATALTGKPLQLFAEECARAAQALFPGNAAIMAKAVLCYGYIPLYRAVCNWFFPSPGIAPFYQAGRVPRRVIGYGALGKAAAACLPLLKAGGMFPALLWDKAGGPGRAICGHPVMEPDYSDLGAGDVVLVFPRQAEVYDDVCRAAKGSGACILPSLDVQTLAGARYYSIFPEDGSDNKG